MPFDIQIPTVSGQPVQLQLDVGDAAFVLGPNGTGKSTLMTLIAASHREKTRRLTAHRQNWWSELNLTLAARRSFEDNARSWDSEPNSRYAENSPGTRPQAAVFDLVQSAAERSHEIAAAVDRNDLEGARRLSNKPSPIAVLNDIFRLSNIAVRINVSDGSLTAVRAGSNPYAIEKLSDGERNALLLTATVLTAKTGSLILIDEPERHLHRSITSPLLRLLFAQRADCVFVVSTHEVMLPAETPRSRTILLRGCNYVGDSVQSFDVDVLSSEVAVDEELKRDILGARRTIVFVEGDVQSLDKPLYALIFPSASVIAKGGCADVEHAVTGIRGTTDLHWIKAVGIVDGDRRSPADIARLEAKGVFPISVLAIEAVYYHTDIQRLVAERHSKLDGSDSALRLAAAKAEALKQIAPHVDRLSRRVAERAIRDEYLMRTPGKSQIDSQEWYSTVIHFASFTGREKTRLSAEIAAGALNDIIQHYPVRTTPALKAIADQLGFQDREHYEAAVRKLLLDDPNALALVRNIFGNVLSEVV